MWKLNKYFVVGLPRTQDRQDASWVIIGQLIKFAHFLPIKYTNPLEILAKLHVNVVVCLHEVPASIVPDQDPRFTSQFWPSMQKALRTKLKFNTTFHPQTDGQSERTIQTLEDILRACMLEFKGTWESHLPLIQFAYSNSYYSSIRMSPIEVLHGHKCRIPICWNEVGECKIYGSELIQNSIETVKIIRERLMAAQSRKKKLCR